MEQYENLMKLFRRECQYAGAARWVLNATLQELTEVEELAPGTSAVVKRLKSRLMMLDLEYNT